MLPLLPFTRKARTVRLLRKHGIDIPRIAYEEAKRAGLPLAVLCAVLEQETGGGRNVWGHDRDSTGRIIFTGKLSTVPVTKENYQAYLRFRKATGETPPYGRMQGVGPMQLTWYTYQDEADREGGCYIPRYNVRIGARILARSIQNYTRFRKYTPETALYRTLWGYNGSQSYADKVLRRVAKWRRILQSV